MSFASARDGETWLPTTSELAECISQEVAAAGGRVLARHEDGRRLFLWSTLAEREEVRPGDAVRGGVAVMTRGEEVKVRPYVFREVCRNGAIMPVAVGETRVRRAGLAASPEEIEAVEEEVREAVVTCFGSEAFSTAVRQMRSATLKEADLQLIEMILRAQALRERDDLRERIVGRFHAEGDASAFGLMNAVTSVARDERDPELRWRLEELGGAVPALVVPRRGAPAAVVSGAV